MAAYYKNRNAVQQRQPPWLAMYFVPAVVVILWYLWLAPIGRLSALSPEHAFLQWLEHRGVQHNVLIKTPAGGERGAFAASRIQPYGLLARVPMRACELLPARYEAKEQLAVFLAQDATETDGPMAPYLNRDLLPMLFDHRHSPTYETFPLEYLHLLKSEEMVEFITWSQERTKQLWEHSAADLAQAGVTFEQLQAAQATLTTRVLSVMDGGDTRLALIPVLDLANHRSNCTTTMRVSPCEQGRSGEGGGAVGIEDMCMWWRAGPEGVEEGEELCIRYANGQLTPDTAFFDYSFILGDDPPGLSRMDMPGFPWGDAELREFDGTVPELEQELERVIGRAQLLRGAESDEAAVKEAPSDPGGRVLRGLKALRRQRVAALEREAQRLRGRIAFKQGDNHTLGNTS